MAVAFEESKGAVVQDVHTPELARKAGLQDNPGFDLLSKRRNGEKRCIEVKGKARIGERQGIATLARYLVTALINPSRASEWPWPRGSSTWRSRNRPVRRNPSCRS